MSKSVSRSASSRSLSTNSIRRAITNSRTGIRKATTVVAPVEGGGGPGRK